MPIDAIILIILMLTFLITIYLAFCIKDNVCRFFPSLTDAFISSSKTFVCSRDEIGCLLDINLFGYKLSIRSNIEETALSG